MFRGAKILDALAQALRLHEEVLGGGFRCHYGEAFGAFPPSRVFVERAVDPSGSLAEPPRDPRQQPPRASAHVVVAHCPSSHVLAGQLRCLARQRLEPGLVLCYAGELYRSEADHAKYSSSFSLKSPNGMVVDGARYSNEASFVNHYVGIAEAPNCVIGSSDEHVATIEVTQPIGQEEELLVDYGLEHCLCNEVPHPRAPAWARDFAALSRLQAVSKRLSQLQKAPQQQNPTAWQWELRQLLRQGRVRFALLSTEGRTEVAKLQQEVKRQLRALMLVAARRNHRCGEL
ncbi:unnamed protein product [Symbiodinium natans]|uniref:SET domain-containing protein n=1 Tax=Symbiodinium natans TaxID=878477 RepID=A0A812SR24_9DINO|nr:unnamed protein product [Symbiodinium natans]